MSDRLSINAPKCSPKLQLHKELQNHLDRFRNSFFQALEFQRIARTALQHRTSASVASVADRGPKLWYINKPMVTTYPRKTGTRSGVQNHDSCLGESCKHIQQILRNARTCLSGRHTEPREHKGAESGLARNPLHRMQR